ncbi:MAG: hypothetical protein IH592_10180 [Bacteroidales bacterium]|nr:hypothetical protein [Bacteroidales bacterium]
MKNETRNNNKMIRPEIVIATAALLSVLSCSAPVKETRGITERVTGRDYPSVFQAWYPVDMQEFPLETNQQRVAVAAKHDLIFEEPLSQLGEGYDLVLGLVWDHKHHGLAGSFTTESLDQALANRREALKINPNMVFLFEIRWRDAPMSFLPEDSPWWLRDSSGTIVKGWLGGWEPFYKLNYDNPEFQDNVARQAKISIESGVYDGVMLDWSGHLEIIKKIRNAIGDSALIMVNIHDDIEDGRLYKDYINGSFMELNPADSLSMPVEDLVLFSREDVNRRSWDRIREALVWFEDSLQKPTVNCLEVWGNRDDLQRMRATTTLGLTHSNGFVLYADPNPLKTPDHLHDWYPFWDAGLGKPLGERVDKEDGSSWREFEGGTVVYNHYSNPAVTVTFNEERKRASDGSAGKEFTVARRDGDIFLK